MGVVGERAPGAVRLKYLGESVKSYFSTRFAESVYIRDLAMTARLTDMAFSGLCASVSVERYPMLHDHEERVTDELHSSAARPALTNHGT